MVVFGIWAAKYMKVISWTRNLGDIQHYNESRFVLLLWNFSSQEKDCIILLLDTFYVLYS